MQSFPSLTLDEFSTAASRLTAAFDSCKAPSWRDVYLKGGKDEGVLVIRRDLEHVDGESRRGPEAEVNDVEDDDDEALVREPRTRVSVEYSILISSSYQVPVLYFALQFGDPDQRAPQDIESVYRYLVPKQFRANLHSVGVVGGISRGYHPISNIPMFFIHPCNTADAMTKMVGQGQINPTAYLLLWIGLVGSCVGLCVDSELVEKLIKT